VDLPLFQNEIGPVESLHGAEVFGMPLSREPEPCAPSRWDGREILTQANRGERRALYTKSFGRIVTRVDNVQPPFHCIEVGGCLPRDQRVAPASRRRPSCPPTPVTMPT
jgi:hypothetical protein